MSEEQRCWSCTYFNAGPSECTYPPMNLPEATWRFISMHHAHPVKTDAGLGSDCKAFKRDPDRVEVGRHEHLCGNCGHFDKSKATDRAHAECVWPGPSPSEWAIESKVVYMLDGSDCRCFTVRKLPPPPPPPKSCGECRHSRFEHIEDRSGVCVISLPWDNVLSRGGNPVTRDSGAECGAFDPRDRNPFGDDDEDDRDD